MFSTPDELVIPTSQAKLVAIGLGSAAFVFAGGWVLSVAAQKGLDGLFNGIVGLAAIAFFGACGGFALFRIVKPMPALVINSKGILDNASALGVGFIAWDEIAELREYTFNNQVFLGIVPRNLDRLLAKQPVWKRRAIRANVILGATPVNVPQAVLPMTVSDLLHEVEVRFRRESDA